MDWIERGIFIALALMLAYTVFILISFCRRYYLAHRESHALVHDAWRAFQQAPRTLVTDLDRGLRTLKTIASVAPLLGLAGTSYGILVAMFFGTISGSRATAEAIISARIAAALTTAAAAILVAIPAILVHNFLRTRITRFEREFSSPGPARIASHGDPANPRQFRLAQTLPLKKRFSTLPPFALVAAPALASVVVMFMSFQPYVTPMGLDVRLASARCEFEGDELIVLHITGAGKLLINQEQESWDGLPGRLSEIYRLRAHLTICLLADDGVPFQTVVDALDVVANVPASVSPHEIGGGGDRLGIVVQLITPGMMKACLEPVATRSRRRASR